jgi:hypothetical protein
LASMATVVTPVLCPRRRPISRSYPPRSVPLSHGAKDALVDAGVFPQLACHLEGIDACLLPPGTPVTSTMNLPVMDPAQEATIFIGSRKSHIQIIL